MRRLKDGKEFAIPAKYVEDTIKQGFEVVTEIGMLPQKAKEKTVTKVEKDTTKMSCPVCQFSSETIEELEQHRREDHAPKPVTLAEEFSCGQCDKSYPKEASLKRHVTRSHA